MEGRPVTQNLVWSAHDVGEDHEVLVSEPQCPHPQMFTCA